MRRHFERIPLKIYLKAWASHLQYRLHIKPWGEWINLQELGILLGHIMSSSLPTGFGCRIHSLQQASIDIIIHRSYLMILILHYIWAFTGHISKHIKIKQMALNYHRDEYSPFPPHDLVSRQDHLWTCSEVICDPAGKQTKFITQILRKMINEMLWDTDARTRPQWNMWLRWPCHWKWWRRASIYADLKLIKQTGNENPWL